MPSRVITTDKLDIHVWGDQIDEATIDQARNLARLPVARHHVALAPDAHVGYGMPIGGVLFTDGAIVPYAIGVDIGCGVRAARTNIDADARVVRHVKNILRQLADEVPVGFAHHAAPQMSARELTARLGGELPPLAQAGMLINRSLHQLGTLGGGNHFLELQRDEHGRLWVMVHSGSRGLGKQLCDHYAERARLTVDEPLPDPNLAWLERDSQDAADYWQAMSFALAWAEHNRELMLERARVALRKHLGMRDWVELIDVHHNYAAREVHFGSDGVVHRKGAVRAAANQTVIVPGSMATASYIGVGLGNPLSFETCQHGAGRAQSRGQAKRAKTGADVLSEMRAMGIAAVSPDISNLADEAASAYKDIEAVMAASADLVRPVLRLAPLGVLKG